MAPNGRISVLHVEVGGSYGGSLRALEAYLLHSDRSRFVHDLLLYYPTPGAERLTSTVRRTWTLHSNPPSRPDKHPERPLVRLLVRGVLQLASLVSSTASADLVGWATLLASLRTARHLSREIRSADYDLVHVNNTLTYQSATLLAARWARKPVIAHVRNPLERGVFSRRIMRLANCVVTVSRSLERELNTWGVPVVVRACYDGVEPPVVDEAASSALRSRLVPQGGVLIGSVGRLDTQKGYHNLIRAARRVIDAHPEVRFAIAGEGPLRRSLESLIAELGLTGRFSLCGFTTDVANFTAALDLFVSSSLWEGLPIAVIEAMLLGKPVIATDVGGNSELVVLGQAGELLPPGDANALATALLGFLERRNTASLSTDEARQIATALANPSANAQTFEALAEQVVATSLAETQEASMICAVRDSKPRDGYKR